MPQMNKEDVRTGNTKQTRLEKLERFGCHLDKEIAYAGQTSAD
jgi:hypothetical protein